MARSTRHLSQMLPWIEEVVEEVIKLIHGVLRFVRRIAKLDFQKRSAYTLEFNRNIYDFDFLSRGYTIGFVNRVYTMEFVT